MPRITTIQHDDRMFFLEYAPLCEHLDVPYQIKVWHLWTHQDYIGNFPTKQATMAHIATLAKGEPDL